MVFGFKNTGLFGNPDTMGTAQYWTVLITCILAMTAGSAVLMWIGERITENGVGNGISIVLTINIISGIPSDVKQLFENFVTAEGLSIGSRFLYAAIIVAVLVGIVVLVVILQGAIRKIGIQMSQKVQGRRQVGAQQSNKIGRAHV